MYRYLFIVLAIVCFACKEQEKQKAIVTENKPIEVADLKKVKFKKIKFSVLCYLCRDWNHNVKDVEIIEDSTVYYRERHNWSIGKSFMAKLDPSDMAKIYVLLNFIDFNALKSEELEEEDSPYFSVKFEMYNGEVKMQGALNVNVWKRVLELLAIVEDQEFILEKNIHFETARDVPPSPPEDLKPRDYNQLLDSL